MTFAFYFLLSLSISYSQARPQVPRRDRAIRTPSLGNRVQSFDVRRLAKVVGFLTAFTIPRSPAGKTSGRVSRKIRASRPSSVQFPLFSCSSATISSSLMSAALRVYRAVEHLAAEIPHVAELLTAQPTPRSASSGNGMSASASASRRSAAAREAPVDRRGRARRQLLRHDRFDEAAEDVASRRS